MKGNKPYVKIKPEIIIKPRGGFFKKDNSLGYTHLPGKFQVTLKDSFTFTATHDENALRITHPIDRNNTFLDKRKIWIFGCSFTYGWSLNDYETFPWIIQEKYTDKFEVINLGVNGYGTIHSLIQLQNTLKTRPEPTIVIITYASFHDERNTFLRNRQKSVATWNFLGPLNQPYATINKKGKLSIVYENVSEYTEWPFMKYSAFIHWLERKYNDMEDYLYNSHDVSKALILKIRDLCKKHHIKLIVAGIEQSELTTDMLNFCKQNNISGIDISVDLNVPENTNLPYDAHPSYHANKTYAKKLIEFLDSLHF